MRQLDAKLIAARATRALAAVEQLYKMTIPYSPASENMVASAYGDARHDLELILEECAVAK